MRETRFYTVTKTSGIKEFLYETLSCSSTFIKRVKWGGVTVNGTVVTMRATVHPGDVVGVTEPEEAGSPIRPIPMPLVVVYEDKDVIAFDKPAGMPTHPCAGNSLPTLAEGVVAYFGDKPFVFRAVNRLDRETSGIVLVAKNALSAERLARAMQEGAFRKEYVAHVVGVPEPREGTVDLPIEREAPDALRRIVRADGKRAVTDYCVLSVEEDGTSFVRLRLHTGRTHQIRVHMAAIGHPLVNDFLYGTQRGNAFYELRAVLLSFPHPTTGERITLTVPEKTV